MAITRITTSAVTDDSVTLAKMAPGTDGNLITYDASGNPAAVATGSAGQVLTSAGAGAPPTFAAAGGITEADTWRLTTSFGGDANPINSNWERADDATAGYLGSGMTQSSGVFTFPSTGIWRVAFNYALYSNNSSGDDRAPNGTIEISSDSGSNYDNVSRVFAFVTTISGNYTHNTGACFAMIDVTNASTFRARFTVDTLNSNTSTYGDSTFNNTSAEFIRLGDT
jgi:hypothetical protein